MYDSPTYESELKNKLSFNDFKKIFDNFLAFCKEMEVKPFIYFTGGDPLLNNEFFKFLDYCKTNNIPFSIMGNPFHLDDATAKKLKDYNIESYQMSIDGLEDTHDYFRKKGSFNETINKFKLLKKHNISSKCMFTLSKTNMSDLIPVIEKINNLVDLFSFARLVPTGCGSDLKKDLIKPKEYRQLLLNVHDKYEELKKKGTTTHFNYKDHLWKLLFNELGLYNNFPKDDLVYDGCHASINHITVLSDGSILLCRRMPILLGNALNDSFLDIFLKNKTINEFRDISKFKKCKNCELLRFCRGCPAVGWALTGDMFAEDPQCWKEI